MPCPSHSPWLDHSNYTWRRVQPMKLLIMQFSPISSGYMIKNQNGQLKLCKDLSCRILLNLFNGLVCT
jgi:hypothetical protein